MDFFFSVDFILFYFFQSSQQLYFTAPSWESREKSSFNLHSVIRRVI